VSAHLDGLLSSTYVALASYIHPPTDKSPFLIFTLSPSGRLTGQILGPLVGPTRFQSHCHDGGPCYLPIAQSRSVSCGEVLRCWRGLTRLSINAPHFVCSLSKSLRRIQRIDFDLLPPFDLVADAVQLTVMDAAQRDGELVAHLSPQRTTKRIRH
jgi:hypothetical protein